MTQNSTTSTTSRPTCFSVGDETAEVVIRGQLKSGTGVVFLLLGLATLGGLLFVTVSPRAEANPRNAALILTATAALLATGAAALALRLERLTIGGDAIVQEKSLWGIRLTRRAIPRASVATLQVQTRGAGGHGLAIIGRQGRLLIGGSLEQGDLEWLRDWVAARLA